MRVWAALTADPGRSDLGIARDLCEPVADGKSALRLTLESLARVRGIEGIAIATAHRGDTARAAGIDPSGGAIGGARVVFVEVDDEPVRERRRAIRGARAFAAHAWRGGAGGWSCIDELVYPEALCDVLGATDAQALLLCGPDWPLVDDALGSDMIERFAEAPGGQPPRVQPGGGGALAPASTAACGARRLPGRIAWGGRSVRPIRG